jgi:hypothetical protein
MNEESFLYKPDERKSIDLDPPPAGIQNAPTAWLQRTKRGMAQKPDCELIIARSNKMHPTEECVPCLRLISKRWKPFFRLDGSSLLPERRLGTLRIRKDKAP